MKFFKKKVVSNKILEKVTEAENKSKNLDLKIDKFVATMNGDRYWFKLEKEKECHDS